jgi:hypothetical protein
MNAQRKKSAIAKYAGNGATREELYNLISADEKQYSADEINEIVDALIDSKKEDEFIDDFGAKKPYQEWKVEVKRDDKGDYYGQKLNIVREKVKITEEQADILNTGLLKGGNTYGVMYFLSETK